MTSIGFVSPRKFDRKVIQLVKVVTRVRDLPRLIAQSSDYLEYAFKVCCFLCLGIGVIVPQITPPAMVRGISKVYKDDLGVTRSARVGKRSDGSHKRRV
jgi:hypothetical protein